MSISRLLSSPLSLAAPSVSYSLHALRVWSSLVDRLTHFVVLEQQICVQQPQQGGDAVTSPDFSAIEAALLAPLWLAGPTPPTVPNSDCPKTLTVVVSFSYGCPARRTPQSTDQCFFY